MTALHIQVVTVRYIFCNVPAMVHKAVSHASAVSLFTFWVAFPAKVTCKAPRLHHPELFSEPYSVLIIGLYHYYLTMSTFCNKFLINYSYFFWDKGKNIKKQWFCNVKYGWYFSLIRRFDWTELIRKFGDRGEAEKSTSEEVLFMEAPPRFELGNRSFADSCLTTWLWRRI